MRGATRRVGWRHAETRRQDPRETNVVINPRELRLGSLLARPVPAVRWRSPSAGSSPCSFTRSNLRRSRSRMQKPRHSCARCTPTTRSISPAPVRAAAWRSCAVRPSTCATTGSSSTTDPAVVQAGKPAKWRFRVFHPGTGEPILKFETVHERQYHLFVISQDMTHFQHIHPELQADGTWVIDMTLPKAGLLQSAVGFPSRGRSLAVHRAAARHGGVHGRSRRRLGSACCRTRARPRQWTISRRRSATIHRHSSPDSTVICSSR